jgi:hypothetical protein
VTFQPSQSSARLVEWNLLANIVSFEDSEGQVILQFADSQNSEGRVQIIHLKESKIFVQKIMSFRGEKLTNKIPLKDVTLS